MHKYEQACITYVYLCIYIIYIYNYIHIIHILYIIYMYIYIYISIILSDSNLSGFNALKLVLGDATVVIKSYK